MRASLEGGRVGARAEEIGGARERGGVARGRWRPTYADFAVFYASLPDVCKYILRAAVRRGRTYTQQSHTQTRTAV